MSTLDHVAQRLANEVGLSEAASRRVARKLNELAKSVRWATPVADGSASNQTLVARRRNPRARPVKRRSSKKAVRKSSHLWRATSRLTNAMAADFEKLEPHEIGKLLGVAKDEFKMKLLGR